MSSFALGVALQLTLSIACAGITAGSRGRRSLGLLLGTPMFALPWLAESPIARVALCLAAVAGFGRVIDLVREPRALPASRRLWHALSPIDSWQAHPVPRHVDVKAFGAAIAWLPAAAVGYFLIREAAVLQTSPWHWLARWGGGVVLVYALADTIHAALAGLYSLGGRAISSQHRTPAAARSLREFWGSRWNRTVSRWLDRSLFRAWARRGQPRVGWALAFLVSATVHAYFVLVAVGWTMALWMGAYFLLQGLLVLAEVRLRVDRWPAAAAHAWVVTLMILTSPLFTEPFLRVLGLDG